MLLPHRCGLYSIHLDVFWHNEERHFNNVATTIGKTLNVAFVGKKEKRRKRNRREANVRQLYERAGVDKINK